MIFTCAARSRNYRRVSDGAGAARAMRTFIYAGRDAGSSIVNVAPCPATEATFIAPP